MTDKEKIREGIEMVVNRRLNLLNGDYFDLNKETNGFTNEIMDIIDSLQKEPVSKVWHDASKEPNDMSHCLIFYGDKNDVGHYLHYEPVLYNHQERVFVTESFPHPTGYKVEQKSIDGGCVAEVYKNKRDRISISDITQWCYLKDLHNLSNVQRTVKNWKEPVSEELEEASEKCIEIFIPEGEFNSATPFALEYVIELLHKTFKAGAEWQKTKLIKDATDVTVHIDSGGYPYIPQMELYDYDKDVSLAKEGDKYKVILIKKE